MKKTIKKFMAILMAFLMGLNVLAPLASDNLFAQNENNYYGVVGAYKAYSKSFNLYEGSTKVANEMIYIKLNNDNSPTLGDIVYCFNTSKSVPDVFPVDGDYNFVPDFGNLDKPLPTYTKINGNVGNTFVDLAQKARVTDNAALVSKVLNVIYNGYRKGGRTDEIKAAYEKVYNEKITDAELYSATQKAIWYYTDSTNPSAEGDNPTITKKVYPVFAFLTETEKETDKKLGLEFKKYTESQTLDLYKPVVNFVNNPYQNLLGTDFVGKNDIDFKYHEIKIKKVDENQKNLGGALLKVTSENDNVLAVWTTQIEDVNDGSNPKILKLTPGKYKLSEISAPSGYKKIDDLTFTVAEDGKISYNGTVNDKTLIIENKSIETMELEVTKKWQNEEGAEYNEEFKAVNLTLLADGKNAVDFSTGKPIQAERNKNVYVFKNIPIYKENPKEKINYQLVEEQIENYTLVTPETELKFVGNKAGEKKQIILTNKKNKEKEEIKVNEGRKSEVQVQKKWSDSSKISKKDVYFELWKIVNGQESKVTKDDLIQGYSDPNFANPKKIQPNNVVNWQKLYFKEDFQKGEFILKVKEVNQDGTDWDDSANGYESINMPDLKAENENIEESHPKETAKKFEVTNIYEEKKEEELTKVKFSKKALTEDGEELEGATIKLTKEDGSLVKEWKTNGSVTEFELKDGKYTFTEVSAPDKYQVATAITFEVKDGKVTVNETEVSGNTIVMVDKLKEVTPTEELTKVKFSKKALTEDGEELEGATIKLTKEDGSLVKEWKTNGSVTEFELKDGKYTFTEVSAPEKYQVATAITFEVKDGKVTVNETEVSGNTIVMVDKLKEVTPTEELTKVKFSKKALTEDGEELEGATIKLTKEDGSLVKEWKTNGSVTEFELKDGKYTFTEVSAPEKYQVATAITFEVKDGKVTVNETEVSGNTIVMVDKLKEEAPKEDEPKDTIKKKDRLPKTGNSSDLSLYAMMTVLSGVLLAVGLRKRRKEN